MRGRRAMIAALGAALVAAAAMIAAPGHAQESKTVTGTAEWRNGKGDCNSGENVPNWVNGTGSPYAQVDMPATVVADGRHVAVSWRDPGFNHGPFFGPIAGDIADDNSFELTGHNEYDPGWKWEGTLDGQVMKGTFTRRAKFSSVECTATWDVTLRLDHTLPLGDVDTTSPGNGPQLCPTKVGEGALEPTQGVWQHDPGAFPDRPGAQLRQMTPTSWDAELPMVSDRPTLVFGAPKHDTIRIVGITSGTTTAKTTLRLTVKGAGATVDTRLKADSASQHLAFFGPCRARKRFVAIFSVPKGVPEKQYFLFDSTGNYTISGQLEARGATFQPAITVTGTVVRTDPPRTLVVPTSLGSAPTTDGTDVAISNLVTDANKIASESQRFIADLYPVALGSYEVHADDDVFYAGDVLKTHTSTGAKDDTINFLASAGQAEVQKRGLAEKYDKIVLLVTKKDYARMDPGSSGSDGYAASQKVVVVTDTIGTKAGSGTATASTVAVQIAHETAHTIPYLWTDEQMKAQCTVNYHNAGSSKVANGYRITLRGEENRKLVDGRDSFMSQIYADTERNWIDQCTYANLVNQLKTS